MMTLGIIPAAVPQSFGPTSQTFGDDQTMTDAEYAALMLFYSPPPPPPSTSAHPGMTDAEYAALMLFYADL